MPANVQVVEISAVPPAKLKNLWEEESRWWREQLRWEATAMFATLQRIARRGSLPGKAVQVDDRLVGCACYGVVAQHGVIASLVMSSDRCPSAAAELLVESAVDDLRRQGVSRIEVSILCSAAPALAPIVERQGFHTYGRDFCRLDLRRWGPSQMATVPGVVQSWGEVDLWQAAAVLQAAYANGIEGEIHASYRSLEGCHTVLDQLLNQGSCGGFIPTASALAHQGGQPIGLALITEIAPQQAHLPQIVVLPEVQHQGCGRALLDYSLSRLSALGFDSLSLIVSHTNVRAVEFYRSLGFKRVLGVPAFIWTR